MQQFLFILNLSNNFSDSLHHLISLFLVLTYMNLK